MQEAHGERTRGKNAINDSTVDGEPISTVLLRCEKLSSSELKTRNRLPAQHTVDRQCAGAADRQGQCH